MLFVLQSTASYVTESKCSQTRIRYSLLSVVFFNGNVLKNSYFFILKISCSTDILLKPSHIIYVVSKLKKNFFTSIKVFLACAKNLATFNHRSFDQKVSVTQITLVYHERSASMNNELSLSFIPGSGISSSAVKLKAHPLTFLKRGGVLLHLSLGQRSFSVYFYLFVL